MVIVMQADSSRADVEGVLRLLADMHAAGYVHEGRQRTIEVLGAGPAFDGARLAPLAGVDRVYADAADLLRADDTPTGKCQEVPLGPRASVGGRRLAVIAGPCSVEDEGRLRDTAAAVAAAGAVGLRGGAFKPRTAPYTFQGLGDRGLEMLGRVREQTGLAIVTEVMCIEHIARARPFADVLQVGSRNMHNTPLLRALGEQDRPVLLKRGWSATLEELLAAAAYIREAGNEQVILCERGIRTFEEYVRNTLALALVPEVKQRSPLPIIVDPSHGTGRAHLVAPMCRAALACGADGLLIEVHPTPARAWSDADQALDFDTFGRLMQALRALAAACGRAL